MIPRGGVVALRALLAMVEQPERWRSGAALAAEQGLPAPFLEQQLLRLRRAGVLEARRGRHGGYRLRRPAPQLSLAEVLAAVAVGPATATARSDANDAGGGANDAACRVTDALQRRLRAALERELECLSLEDLRHDLRSSRAALSEEGGLLLG
ncbi:MAG: Rrf2 family transcriptional regulator [Synechococcaceae cyanobacterium]|nr:Rrf2 family transcriptional regulator [Synechococcaceae cyanobacterium]